MKLMRILMILAIGALLVAGVSCSNNESTTYQLTTVIEGQGNVSPSSGTYTSGNMVTLNALPASGWEFDHWGNQANGTGNPITITLDSDKTVSVYFTNSSMPTPTQTFLFSDDFSDESSGWQTYEYYYGYVIYDEGHLLINSSAENWFISSDLDRRFTDFVLEVETQWVGGSMMGHSSVFCRKNNMGNFYVFVVSTDGSYSIYKSVDEDITIMAGPILSEYIKCKKNDINLIRIECVGSKMSLSVNGHLLSMVYDSNFTDGSIALGAGVWNDECYEVAFDNVVIDEP
jgi:hypothetical protein